MYRRYYIKLFLRYFFLILTIGCAIIGEWWIFLIRLAILFPAVIIEVVRAKIWIAYQKHLKTGIVDAEYTEITQEEK